MKILFLDQYSDPGGAQFCLRDLMPEILRRGWESLLMVPGNGQLVGWCQSSKIPTYELPLKNYSSGRKTIRDFWQFGTDVPRAAAAVRTIVKRERIDLVYVNGPRALPAVVGISRPVVFHAHHRPRSWYCRKLVRSIVGATNALVIAVSAYVARDYPRARVIYAGVADLLQGTRTFDRRPARIGIIGRIAPEKGQLDFVRAAERLRKNGVSAEFFIHGSPLFADPAYEAQVRSAVQGATVKFCGWADPIERALHNLEIVVVPSGPDEAAARVIMEALSAGAPVVAYRAGGIPEIVDHLRTGLLTERADPESLALAIGTLLEDRQLMHRLSVAGREEWERRFRVERFRSSVCDLLESRFQNTSEGRRG